MSYAEIDEIKSLFRDFADNVDAAVDDTEITLFLANTNEVIDAKIGTLYTLPLTLAEHPKSWALLKQLQMFLVADIVDDILNSYSEADKKPQWGVKGQALLTALVPGIDPKTCRQCTPSMILPDAPYLGTEMQRGRVKISSTSGRQFTKGGNDW